MGHQPSSKSRTARFRSSAFWCATGLGSGLSSIAPGTVGTIVAGLLFFSFWTLLSLELRIAVALLLLIIGLWSSRAVLRKWYREDPNSDPKEIVIDEWCGMAIAMLLLGSSAMLDFLVVFVLFRFFDVLKPGPIKLAERLPAEWGIMLDDVVAGFFALIVYVALAEFFPAVFTPLFIVGAFAL